MSRRLVIDASLARSASERVGGPSARARSVLECILEVCHRIVFSHDGFEEWKRHESRYARRWRVQMVSRKKWETVGDCYRRQLREALREAGLGPAQLEEAEKDLHLVEAALEADGVVLSRDERARRLLSRVAASVPEVGAVTWVNPDRDEERPREWLEAGAPREPERAIAHLNRGE